MNELKQLWVGIHTINMESAAVSMDNEAQVQFHSMDANDETQVGLLESSSA